MREKSEIGERIKAELNAQNKTQAWLSDETGIQKGYLSELINGHPKKRWNEDLLKKVSLALGMSLVLDVDYIQNDEAVVLKARDVMIEHFKEDAFKSKILKSLFEDEE